MKKLLVLAIVALGLSMGFAQKARADIDIAVVTHGGANNPFWVVVYNAVNDACKDFGVKCTFDAPDTFDLPLMAQMIMPPWHVNLMHLLFPCRILPLWVSM